ncbi:retron-type reverse transcriptase [Bradyrhizobium sp. LM2.7]
MDADLKDYFGSVDHEKLMALLGKQIADSGVLTLIQQMLKAGYEAKGQRFETPRGTPQGGVISPLLSNILLTPFDKEMRQKGYRLTRWADDWVVTCRTRAEAEHALARAGRILETLGVTLNREKTRIVHIAHGFEFLGFKIQRGKAGWIIRRLWSHRAKRWRNAAWKEYPTRRLRTEFKLVGLVSLIPSLQAARARS